MKSTSFIIIPERSSRSFTFHVPNLLLFSLLTSLAVGVVSFVVLIGLCNRFYKEAVRVGELTEENRKLKAEAAKVAELSRQIVYLQDLDLKVRRLLGQKVDTSIYQQALFNPADSVVARGKAKGTAAVSPGSDRGELSGSSVPSLWPVKGKGFISRGFSTNKGSGKHYGIDIAVSMKTPVVATADGLVAFADLDGDWGRKIVINHGNGYESIYAHLSRIEVKKGEMVKRGSVIGLTGNSGRSTAPHLHYEVRFQGRPYDPEKFIPISDLLIVK